MSHIFLYGPSGSGKTTIGKRLADNLRLPFVDSDQVLEANAGMSIPRIVEADGMSKVREWESAALRQIISGKESVVALGGGALLREENRALVEDSGTVILLAANLETLVDRLQHDTNQRPLLAGDLRSKLASYLGDRAEHYASFPLKIQVDGRPPEQLAYQVQVMVGRHHLSAMGEYDVLVAQIAREASLWDNLRCGNFVVTDENVAKIHLDKIKQAIGQDAKAVIIPAGEDHKNLETVSRLWKSFLEIGLDRKSTVIALGGGVVGDMAGFAAATYMRGIDWIAMPTTLLSMVDASIGGKTGFDLPEGKNLIGAFYPPKMVLADPSLLKTLPECELISGMAEVVKHGIISDPELFELCSRGMDWVKANLEETVKRAMAVKIKVIEEDPYEKGIRAALNLGHTVGHAVELVSKFELRHGEAISIGTVVEARYAERIGIADKGLADRIAETLIALELPTQIPDGVPHGEIIRAMRVDKKKNAKAIRFALPAEIGRVELVEVSDLESVLDDGR
ncbi:MAG: 3-dehydroquinate synthase [Chloroflexi bacterium]|nr:3-dehydroquinate synthase [Chloroflexota bacterium]